MELNLNINRMVVLTGVNYQSWKTKMEDLLYVRDLYMPVFLEVKPDGKSDAEWEILHRKACGFIRQWVGDNVSNHVSGETNARTLWQKLESLFARKEGTSQLFLIKRLMQLRFSDDQPVADHLNVFQGLMQELTDTGLKLEEKLQALMLLGSFPDSWETLKIALCNTAPDGDITLDLVKAKVMSEESRRACGEGPSSSSSAVVAAARRRTFDKGKKAGKVTRVPTEIECWHCHKKGHTKRDCPKLVESNEEDEGNSGSSCNYHEEDVL